MEEILKACEGKLGQYYKLALRTKLEKDEINNKNILNIRVRMIQETNTEPTLVCKNKASIKLYINDEFVDKSFVDINFTNKNNLLLYTYKKDNTALVSGYLPRSLSANIPYFRKWNA